MHLQRSLVVMSLVFGVHTGASTLRAQTVTQPAAAETQPPSPSVAPASQGGSAAFVDAPASAQSSPPPSGQPAAQPTSAAPPSSGSAPPPPPYATGAEPPPPQGAPQPEPQPAYAAAPPSNEPPPPTYAASSSGDQPAAEQYGGGDDSSGSLGVPDFSVRIDPLNWILYGQLGLELELEIAEWLTFETVPMFIVSEQPVVFNQADDIYQKGDGLGALAGASLGLGFWLDGDSFNGTVLRPSFSFYSIEYRSEALDEDAASFGVAVGDVMDRATVNQRRLGLTIGSHRTWGFFTLAGGFGVEYELNSDRRCFARPGTEYHVETSDPPCSDDDEFLLARSPLGTSSSPSAANLLGALHPFYIAARLSLGFVLDD